MTLAKSTQFMLAFMFVFTVIYVYAVDKAKKGAPLLMRRVAGLDAIDEAIGRCTEMGRPVHYTFGTGEFDGNILASFNVLAYVADKCARTETDLIVSNCHPEVQAMTEEIVKAGYTLADKIENYKSDNIRYLSRVQTAYIAGIFGIFARERPGANLMMGAFFAESLQIAEVGNLIGAIQVGGTGRTIQVPFFVAACDYTLIGDELFAAGAYLSRQPAMVGTIYSQDFGKWIAIVLVVVGCILNTMKNSSLLNLLKR